jgi:hypothetical protein
MEITAYRPIVAVVTTLADISENCACRVWAPVAGDALLTKIRPTKSTTYTTPARIPAPSRANIFTERTTPMATAAQITANRLNAAHSTGPRTPEGKARAAQNALRHGLTASHLVVAPGRQEELEALRAALLEELDPQGITEVLTFNEILHAAWNLHRFRLIEARHAAGPDALDDPAKAAFLDRLGRYQARAQRAYFRALNELRTLQTNRTLRSVKLTEEEEREVPVLADVNELTKQTHSEVTAQALRLAEKMINIETAQPRIDTVRERAPRPAPENPALRL